MGPVHLYLAAWVAGGVLLGASMLLDGRETAPSEAGAESERGAADPYGLRGAEMPALVGKAPRAAALLRLLRLGPFGLIGFGLCGLTAKGLNLDLWPWTFVCALTVGLSLIALGYGLSRPRSR
jgi:hypothetical protein